jgi:hypothetical protein
VFVLAASGETVSGWKLCANGQCNELGITAEQPIKISLCK